MHTITRYDREVLLKYNLKNNTRQFFRSILSKVRKNYYISWVNGRRVLMRKGKTDILVFKKIFIEKEYDFNLGENIYVIIDAGANIGLSSIFFATKYPNATVIAIEPELSNFDLLKLNVSSYPNIHPLLGGINNESGKFTIKNPAGDHWNFMLEKNPDAQIGDGTFFTIEDIMQNFGFASIDFLKIDIEGGEETLFKSNYGWLKKIKALSIELHDFILPTSSNTFFKAISHFEPYTFLNHGENYLIIFKQQHKEFA